MNQYIIRNINDIFAIPEDFLDEFIIDLKAQYETYNGLPEKTNRDLNMIFIPDGRHDNISGFVYTAEAGQNDGKPV